MSPDGSSYGETETEGVGEGGDGGDKVVAFRNHKLGLPMSVAAVKQ